MVRSIWGHNYVARDVTRDMTSRARLKWRHYGNTHFLMSGCYGGCYEPISSTAGSISLIFGRQVDMAKQKGSGKIHHHRPNIKATGQFLLNTMATVWLPWKPMPLGSIWYRPIPSCRVWPRSDGRTNPNYSMIFIPILTTCIILIVPNTFCRITPMSFRRPKQIFSHLKNEKNSWGPSGEILSKCIKLAKFWAKP